MTQISDKTKEINKNKRCVVTSLCRYVVKDGFSMVELMVAIGIIAILSITSIVGFGYLSDIMRSRQVSGVIQDMIKGEELKVLRGDFKKSSIHFIDDFIILDEESDSTDSKLLTIGTTCGSGGYYLNFSDNGNLTKKDQDGRIMDIMQATSGMPLCVEFNDSYETMWSFQLSGSEKLSDFVTFAHFNLDRNNLNDPVSIKEGAGSVIVIEAPYAKKTLFDDSGTKTSIINLKLKDKKGNTEEEINLK